MWTLQILLPLLTACLAAHGGPVALSEDIQVQENFDLPRVRLCVRGPPQGVLGAGAQVVGVAGERALSARASVSGVQPA